MAASLSTLESLARDRSDEGREVFYDAVNELTPDQLVRVMRPLVEDLRSDDAPIAGRALITASRILGVREDLPNVVNARELSTAKYIVRENYAYRTTPWTAFVSSPWPGLPATPVETMYDATRAAMRIAADNLERFLERTVPWLEDIRVGHFDPEDARSSGAIRIRKDGRVVSRSQNLRGVTEYAHRAQGTDLIVLEIVPSASERYPDGRLHILYRDGATLTTFWHSFEGMENWLANKMRNRTSWLAGAPTFVLRPEPVARDYAAPRRRGRRST